jgi:hypothetical protein
VLWKKNRPAGECDMNEWILILTLTQQGANYATAHIEDVQTTFITKKLCEAAGEAWVRKQKFEANYICAKRFEIPLAG